MCVWVPSRARVGAARPLISWDEAPRRTPRISCGSVMTDMERASGMRLPRDIASARGVCEHERNATRANMAVGVPVACQ